MTRSIHEAVVVVTGASSGIGRATALALGREGARLALGARRVPLLLTLTEEIEAEGGESFAVPTDVADRTQIRNLMEATVRRWDRIDVVVVNAGIWLQSPISETTEQQWRRVMEIDYFAAVATTLEALPHMGNGGHVIFVNSLEGRKGVPLEGAYAAAKHALAGFAGVARQELASRGILVTSVFPGRVDTPLIERLWVPAVQAKMPADAVAAAVVSAIRRPRREIYLPALSGRVFSWLGLVAPGLSDRAARLLRLQGRMD